MGNIASHLDLTSGVARTTSWDGPMSHGLVVFNGCAADWTPQLQPKVIIVRQLMQREIRWHLLGTTDELAAPGPK